MCSQIYYKYFSFVKSGVLNIKMDRGDEIETLYIEDLAVSSIFRIRIRKKIKFSLQFRVEDALEDLLSPVWQIDIQARPVTKSAQNGGEHSLLLVPGHQPIFRPGTNPETNHILVRELKEGS